LLAMDLQASRLFQNKYVIIYDHRQQAGSYKGGVWIKSCVNENRSQARTSSTRVIEIE